MFLCFVFIWEQTATCAAYSINWLVFITEMKSVYCAVRTGALNKAVCCIYLRTNSDLCHLQHKLIGFYNRDEKCLLLGTNWVFKQSSLLFVFKGSRKRLWGTWRPWSGIFIQWLCEVTHRARTASASPDIWPGTFEYKTEVLLLRKPLWFNHS